MLKKYLTIFLISMVPILELRGAIPYSVGFGLPSIPSFIVCVIGNMIPVPFIYWFARRVPEWERQEVYREIFDGAWSKASEADRNLWKSLAWVILHCSCSWGYHFREREPGRKLWQQASSNLLEEKRYHGHAWSRYGRSYHVSRQRGSIWRHRTAEVVCKK